MWPGTARVHLLKLCAGIILLTGSPSLAPTQSVYAQDELEIYGHFQNRFSWRYQDGNPASSAGSSTSFLMQQLNVLFRKQFDSRFSAFLNLEATQSYSSEERWGTFRVEEAWMRYRNSRQLNIKAGMLIPTYNYLNKIKNRTPLLPYLLRPLVYETTTDGLFSAKEFIPRQAFFEIYGTIPLSEQWEAQYAVFVGNQEDFVTDITASSHATGEDTSKGLLIGGRIGFKYNSLSFGVSSTIDQSNQKTVRFSRLDFPGPGVLKRYRIGLDVSRSYTDFFFSGELTKVLYTRTPESDQRLEELRALNPFVNDELDRLFFYLTVGYYFNEKMYVYGSYSYLEEEILITLSEGAVLSTVGYGYHPIPQVALKVQALDVHTRIDSAFFFEVRALSVGFSIFF